MCPMLFTQLIFLWSERVMSASSQIWQILADYIHLAVLGGAGAADVFPGMILFTGQDPDPFWAEAIVLGTLGTMLCGEPASRLLLGTKVLDGVAYPEDSWALMASLHTPFAGCRPESSLEVACLASLLATAAIASCFKVRESRSLSYVATGAGRRPPGSCLATSGSLLPRLGDHRL